MIEASTLYIFQTDMIYRINFKLDIEEFLLNSPIVQIISRKMHI